MPFVLRVACDVGSGTLNTGVDFGSRPSALRDVVAVIEALYTAELRLHRQQAAAAFRCVSLMALSESGTWTEVVACDQLRHNAQLFAFDWSSPPPSSRPVPSVQFVATASQILRASQRSEAAPAPTTAVGGSAAASAPASRPSLPAEERKPTSQWTPTPARANLKPGAPLRIPTSETSPASPLRTASRADSDAACHTQLPPEARQYLFEQLCRASGSRDTISTHRLHGIFVEYGLTFSTETFSEIVGAKFGLDRDGWAAVEAVYGPVVDALYDRIATRSAAAADVEAARSAGDMVVRSVGGIRDELMALEEEEARLLARRAEIRLRAAGLQRELREAEAAASRLARPNATEDRAKEWDTLQKFVALRHRQTQLRREEERVRHELSLL